MSLAKYERLWATAYGSFVKAIRRNSVNCFIAPKELSNVAVSDIADIIKEGVWIAI